MSTLLQLAVVPGVHQEEWLVTALSLRMGKVTTSLEKKEARFRLLFLEKIRNEPWYFLRAGDLDKEGFSYTSNINTVSRKVFLADILKGLVSDVEYALDTKWRAQ